ncbi:MAG: hypothetical protein ACUVUU_08975 [bacterium]
MRFITLISLLLVVGSVVAALIGCGVDTTGPEDSREFKNPYDWVGVKHNDCLQYVVERVKKNPEYNWSIEDAKALVEQYFGSDGDHLILVAPQGVARPVSKATIESAYELASRGSDYFVSFLDSLKAEGLVSPAFVAFAREILRSVDRGEGKDVFDDIGRRLDAHDLTAAERQVLLLGLAVADHSSAFWQSELEEITKVVNRGKSVTDSPFEILSIPPAAAIAGMDLIGGGGQALITYLNGGDFWDVITNGLVGAATASGCGFLSMFVRGR